VGAAQEVGERRHGDLLCPVATDKRGAKRWVAEVVELLGFFDLSADWRAVEKGLHLLDQAAGDVTGAGAELQRLKIVPASSTKNSLFKSA